MKLTYTILILCLATSIYAQSADSKQALQPDQRLFEVYDAGYIDRLLVDNPFLIKRWNFYLEHSFSIIDAIPGKTDEALEIIVPDLAQINILLLEKEQKLTHDHHVPVIYKIKNTNKCLVYESGKKFLESFKESLVEN